MADLSEHLGREAEFFVLLLLFALLLSMHAPFRRAIAMSARFACDKIKQTFTYARANSASIRNWADALLLSIQDRQGFFLIILVLVIFDYLINALSHWTRMRDYFPNGTPFLHEFISSRYISISYSIEAFTCVGYALFGWLAFQRAQGIEFSRAATFTPMQDVFLFFLFVTAVDVMAARLASVYFYDFSYMSMLGAPYWLSVAKALIFSAAFMSVAGYLLFFVRHPARLYDLVRAVAGYVLLVHLLQMYQWTMTMSALPGPAFSFFSLSMDFFVTVVWTILYVAFCILLGQAAQGKACSNPKNVAPRTD